jgi:hypothetical protein
MSRLSTSRPSAAWPSVLTAAVFIALTGCGTGEQPKTVKKDGQAKPSPSTGTTGAAQSSPPPTPALDPTRPPERIESNSAVGQEAIHFLTAVGAGTARADQLSSGFVRLIGLPVELPGDKARGYSPDAAESWLRRVGAKLTGMGPMTESFQAGDVAVFRGRFTGGTYWLRMVKEAGAWKADWLSLSSVETTGTSPAGSASAETHLQSFAATAVATALCDKDAMPREERLTVIAAGLTPAFRQNWAEPFDGDKLKGYDHSPAKLGVKVGGIGNLCQSVAMTPTGPATFQMEVTRTSGEKASYTLKLAKGPTPGQWLVESISP